MNKVDPSEELVRKAIWDVYNHKCFYTGDPLEYTNMELDHVIPESFKKRYDDFNLIISECGLGKDFEIDSLYNLVPTNKFENNRKSDIRLSNTTLMHYLELVKVKVPTIEIAIEKLRKTRNFENHLSLLKSFYKEEKDEKSREQILEKIANFIDDNEDFVEQDSISENEGKLIYKKYTKRIGLDAILPQYNNPETTCTLQFRTLKAQKCMIVLDNKSILSELFVGLYTDAKYGTKDFIWFDEDPGNHKDINDLNNSVIHISNNKLFLSVEDIYSLCEVIDSYATKYIEAINNIENILKSYNFSLSRRRNNYKLVNISYHNWLKLIEFAIRHDTAKGRTLWHIFDKNRFFIKIYNEKELKTLNSGYHAFFNAEFHEDIVLYPGLTSNDVCITFEFIEDLDKRGLVCINPKENWNVEIAYEWLVNQFIPKVLGDKWNKASSRKNDLSDLFIKNDTRMNYLVGLTCGHFEELQYVIQILQMHYHTRPHSNYRISKQDFSGIYNSIILCLKRSKKADIHYLCEKLHLSFCRTEAELIEAITDISEKITDLTIDGFGIDYLFRSLYAVLESRDISLSFDDIAFIRSTLDVFIDTHDREVLLEKYAQDFT